MAGAGVDLDVVVDPISIESRVEGAAGASREVVPGVRADHGAGALHRIDRPWVGGVEGGDRFQPVVRARPRDGKTAAHAETDGAEPQGIDCGNRGQIGQRSFEVADPGAVNRPPEHPRYVTRHAQGAVAIGEQVDGERGVAAACEAVGDVLDVFVEAVRLVDHDHARVRAVTVWQGGIASAFELTPIDLERLHMCRPGRWYRGRRVRSEVRGIITSSDTVGPWRSWERV